MPSARQARKLGGNGDPVCLSSVSRTRAEAGASKSAPPTLLRPLASTISTRPMPGLAFDREAQAIAGSYQGVRQCRPGRFFDASAEQGIGDSRLPKKADVLIRSNR